MHLHYKNQINGYKVHGITLCHCSGSVATQLFYFNFDGICSIVGMFIGNN